MSQLKTKFIEDSAITTAKVAADAVTGAKVRLDNNESIRGRNNADNADVDIIKVNASDDLEFSKLPVGPNSNAPTVDAEMANKKYVDDEVAALISGLSWQAPVLDRLAAPPGGETTGDRYLVIATGSGAFAGKENQIATYNGSGYDFLVATNGFAVLVEDELDGIYIFSGSVFSKKQFEATTGGTGTTLNVNAIDVNVDDSSIEINGSDQVSIKDLGVTNAMLAGSIADAKLAQDYIQTSEVDDSSIEFGTTLNVKALGITDGMLAGSISDGKLAQDYVQTSEVDGTTIKFTTQLEGLTPSSEIVTLSAGQITAQAVDLAEVCHSAAAIRVSVEGGLEQLQGTDYTVSLTGGAGGVTQIAFAGDLATAGAAELIAADKLIVTYEFL